MPDPDIYRLSPEQEELHRLLGKIIAYQSTLPDGRAVELDELQREGILTSADLEFLTSHSVTYKPHRVSDFHAMDMFHLPMKDGCCLFTGSSGPPLVQRRAPLKDFGAIVENFFKLPRPQDELLLHIEFTEHDGLGVAPESIFFTFGSPEWQARLPAIRSVTAECGLKTFQDGLVQSNHVLTFDISPGDRDTAAAVVALLSQGCGFTNDAEIVYSAGALDEA